MLMKMEDSTGQVGASVWPEIAPLAIREQLEKILGNGIFAESPRMARFLHFAVEEALRGNASQLKESVIGMQVFDRHADYDPRLDPIVRVEARRLRTKLQTYYEGSGRHDSVVVEFPKGRYAPAFRMRSSSGAVEQKTHRNTIAILPFLNLNAEGGSEFLSDGLTEELINALTRIPELRVVAWNSAVQLKGQQGELETVRDRLDVEYVLRGSVRQTTDRLRVSAHLIETRQNHYVWSEIYDRKLRDIFDIQEDIAQSMVNALQLRFTQATELSSEAAGAKRNLNSYQLCLKGRFHARERTAEGLQRSVICFEQAIAEDPNSASAHAGLADTHTLLAEYGFVDSPTSMEKAKQSVKRALELNPESAEAHASFGLILTLYDWAWAAAEEAFKRSLRLNPGYGPAHHWYGVDHLAQLGRLDEATRQLEIGIQLDPLSPVMLGARAYVSLLRRDYATALGQYRTLLAQDPSYYKAYTALGRAYIQQGLYPEAIASLEKGLALAGEVPSIFGALGQAHGLAGNASRAREMAIRLREIAATRPVPSACFALIHLGLGERDQALDWLERAADRRESSIIGLKVHPAVDVLRDEPRFRKLLERIGFDR